MVNRSRKTGDHWEQVAERFLTTKGLCLLERNYNCRVGELDLIMRDNTHVVFVEVRFRRRARFGTGADTVHWQKQRRLSAAARRYLAFHPSLQRTPCRFDVVSIGQEQGRLVINWVQNAFDQPG